MTMTPWNLTHGQWSKNLTMATDILESASWSMVKMVISWSNFVVRSKVYHFDHGKWAALSWNLPHGQWSKWLFRGQTSWLDQRFTILTMENLYLVHGYDGQNGYICG